MRPDVEQWRPSLSRCSARLIGLDAAVSEHAILGENGASHTRSTTIMTHVFRCGGGGKLEEKKLRIIVHIRDASSTPKNITASTLAACAITGGAVDGVDGLLVLMFVGPGALAWSWEAGV
jgi:hypothetical protein